MAVRTEYIFDQSDQDILEEDDDVESSLSEDEKKEYGFVQYKDDDDPSDGDNNDETPVASGRDSLDFDIKDIRVEFHRKETPAELLLGGTILSKFPFSPPRPPSQPRHRRRSSESSSPSDAAAAFTQPYYEERGELSGHFEPDRLSSDFVAKPPNNLLFKRTLQDPGRRRRRSCHGSSNDSGVSSQSVSCGTPQSYDDGFYDSQEEFVDLTDEAFEDCIFTPRKFSTRSSSRSTNTEFSDVKRVRLKLSRKDILNQSSFVCDDSNDGLPSLNFDRTPDLSDNLSDNIDSDDSRPFSRHKPAASQPHSMTRQKFHRGSFVRARYPVQMHTDKFAKQKQAFKPPASLCPPSRYGKEARIIKKNTKTSSKKTTRQWQEVPRYPPKARHAYTECDILKLVETLELGVQCNPIIKDSAAQCTVTTMDNCTQYPKVRRKNCTVQTSESKEFVTTAGVQSCVEMRSRMVETSHRRVLYLPAEITTAPHAGCVQCEEPMTRRSCETQSYVDAAVMGQPAGPKTSLSRRPQQDTIDRIKAQNKRDEEKKLNKSHNSMGSLTERREQTAAAGDERAVNHTSSQATNTMESLSGAAQSERNVHEGKVMFSDTC